jgi:hypothetical protein
VDDESDTPKYPAAYVKIDLGIVPGAQQSTEISNWLQDEIIAMINKSGHLLKFIQDAIPKTEQGP